jgi:hypothetical protein
MTTPGSSVHQIGGGTAVEHAVICLWLAKADAGDAVRTCDDDRLPSVCLALPIQRARPKMLTPDMKRIIEEQRLGFVATAAPDGTPNVSPKGTFVVVDDETIAFKLQPNERFDE